MRHGFGRLERQLQHVDGAQRVLADDLLLHLGRAIRAAPASDGATRGDRRVEGIGAEQPRDEGRILVPHEGLDIVEEDPQRLLAIGHLPELGQEAHHLHRDAHWRAVQVEPGQDRVPSINALQRAGHQLPPVADIGELRQLLDDTSQLLEVRSIQLNSHLSRPPPQETFHAPCRHRNGQCPLHNTRPRVPAALLRRIDVWSIRRTTKYLLLPGLSHIPHPHGAIQRHRVHLPPVWRSCHARNHKTRVPPFTPSPGTALPPLWTLPRFSSPETQHPEIQNQGERAQRKPMS